MKRFVAKAALVAASVAALMAFAVPAMASAATWGPLGASKVLEAKEPEVIIKSGGGPGGFRCLSSQLKVHVRGPASATLDVTGFTLEGCVGWGIWVGVWSVNTAELLPWTINASSPTAASLNVGRVLMSTNGGPMHFQGTQAGGTWNNAQHTLTFAAGSASGMFLTEYSGYPVYLYGVFRDPSQQLTLS
jgi:hypothetical protein